MIESLRKRDISQAVPLNRDIHPTRSIGEAYQALERHSPWSFTHSMRVGIVAERIGDSLGMPRSDLKALRKAGSAHDLGKIYVPPEILNKGSRNLTDDEREKLDIHPAMSFHLISEQDPETAIIIIAHHEFQDRNYPRNLPRPEDSRLKRLQSIIALADQTDALLSERPYKPAWEEQPTKEELTRHFPIEIVNFAIDSRTRLESV